MERVMMAMSGGVDSAVSAYLLQQAGYDVVGGTMCLHQKAGETCGSSAEAEDARAIASRLGIPFFVFDFTAEFHESVVRRFVQAYERGETPNPCIDCNRALKFDRFLRASREMGCDKMATGHYARIEQKDGRFRLRKAKDLSKDQSYVLYGMTQEALAHTLFPLGELTKTEVRAIALRESFENARKHDSQDICFVPDGDYAAVIERLSGKTYPEGAFVDRDGRVLGTHKGLIRYTVGQRKGLGLSLPSPMYVCEKQVAENRVVLGTNEDLFSDTLRARDFNWIAYDTPPTAVRCKARIRYQQTEQDATAYPEGETVRVVFDTPQRAISKGQAVVLYDGEYVLGGGTIL